MPTFLSLECMLHTACSPTFLKFFNITSRVKPSRRKTSFQSLPNEILLEIFSFLELKPYLVGHGVCKKWRNLLPLAKLDPTRNRLLNLYHRILDTPGFEKTLEWTNQNHHPIDREVYIHCLLEQYPVIPEEFRMWILEWPARLVIQCIWPGLPFTFCRMMVPVSRRNGVNWLAYRSFSPQLLALAYKEATPFQTFIPGLFIWRDATETDWLVFEQDKSDLFGRVIVTTDQWHSFGGIPYYPSHPSDDDHANEDNSTESGITDSELYLVTYDDWIVYLHKQWSDTVREIENPSEMYLYPPDIPIRQPVACIFDNNDYGTLPAPAWASNQRIIKRQTF